MSYIIVAILAAALVAAVYLYKRPAKVVTPVDPEVALEEAKSVLTDADRAEAEKLLAGQPLPDKA
jgi:beta-lactam-binding protein with PASTA domain